MLLFNNEVHRTKESEIFDAIMVVYDIIGHSRILLLFNNEVHRTKESEIFDAIMVAYDKAVVYKLIGTFYFVNFLKNLIKDNRLYGDGRLSVFNRIIGP